MPKVPMPCKIYVESLTGISEFQIPFSERYQKPAGTLLLVCNQDIVSPVPTRVLLAFCMPAVCRLSLWSSLPWGLVNTTRALKRSVFFTVLLQLSQKIRNGERLWIVTVCEKTQWYRKITSGTFWGPSRSNTVVLRARIAEMKIVLAQTVSQVRMSYSSETSTKITESKGGGAGGWMRKGAEEEEGMPAGSVQYQLSWHFVFVPFSTVPLDKWFSVLHSSLSIFPVVNLSLPLPGLSQFLLSF